MLHWTELSFFILIWWWLIITTFIWLRISIIQPVEEEEDEEEDEEHEDDDSESRDEAEDSDIDVDSFTANGPNFSRDLGADGPPRLGNLTMDLSEWYDLIIVTIKTVDQTNVDWNIITCFIYSLILLKMLNSFLSTML